MNANHKEIDFELNRLKENKGLIECIEQLLLIIDPKLYYFSAKEVGKHKSYIWNKVVTKAQKLIKQKKKYAINVIIEFLLMDDCMTL